MIDLINTTKYCRGNYTTFPNRRNKLQERALPSAVSISRISPGVFVLVHGVFVLVHGVFILVQGVFVLVQGVFILVQGVFVLVQGVFVLSMGSQVLGLRFWVFILETPVSRKQRPQTADLENTDHRPQT